MATCDSLMHFSDSDFSDSNTPSLSCPSDSSQESSCLTTLDAPISKMSPEIPINALIPNIGMNTPIISIDNFHNLNFIKSKKRKNLDPQRSIPSKTALICNSIKLDTYEQYKTNPKFLLYKKSKSTLPISTPLNSSTHSEYPNRMQCSDPTRVRGGNRPCKSVPDFVRDFTTDADASLFDINEYKNTQGAPNVHWKAGAQKLDIPRDAPGIEDLTPEELKLCVTLRFMPDIYLHMKRSLLNAVFTYGPYKKRDAQLWFRIDVNKTSQVYDWFRALGWIPRTDEEWMLKMNKS